MALMLVFLPFPSTLPHQLGDLQSPVCFVGMSKSFVYTLRHGVARAGESFPAEEASVRSELASAGRPAKGGPVPAFFVPSLRGHI